MSCYLGRAIRFGAVGAEGFPSAKRDDYNKLQILQR